MTERFDAIRAENPDLGFALYALEPGGPVTLEIVTPDGGLFTFKGATAAAAIEAAFPTPSVSPTPPQPTTNVLD